MAFTPSMARTLRAVRDSLESDGVSRTNVERALQAGCDVERDSMLESYANRINARSVEFSRNIAEHRGIHGVDSWTGNPAEPIPEPPTIRPQGRKVRSARFYAERHGMIDSRENCESCQSGKPCMIVHTP